MAEEEAEELTIPLSFVGAEDVPVLYANQFVVQFMQDGFILTVGQLTPPILLGTGEEKREKAKQLSLVPVKVVARLAIDRRRVEELVNLLRTQLERFDEEKRKGG
jgi:hypothetical protein